MKYKLILRPLAVIASVIALFMIIPAGIALYLNETASAKAFIYVISLTIAVSSVVIFISRNWEMSRMSTKESFFLVSSGWIISSFVGALPFYISGSIGNFTDAFFETASGFTTTGATILTDRKSVGVGKECRSRGSPDH